MKHTKVWQKNKELVLQALPNLVMTILIIGVMIIFRFTLLTMILFFCGLTILIYSYTTLIKKKKAFKIWELIKSVTGTVIFILIIVFLMKWLKGYGWIGLIIFVLMIVGFKLFTNWKLYKELLDTVEVAIFGKPLKPENWKGGKRPRLKLVWRRKNENQKKN